MTATGTTAPRRPRSALSVHNYRAYFLAQLGSQTGTWLQFMGQIWLVVKILAPGNGVALGVTASLQSLPILLTLWGGSLVDAHNRRHVLLVTQTVSGLLAASIGVAALAGSITLAQVWVCAFLLGMVNAVDGPARQAFVTELVGDDLRRSAISLNSASYQGTRAIGVALAPVLIDQLGISWPFLVNAVSFALTVAALATMRVSELHPVPPAGRRPPVREGLAALQRSREMLGPVLLLLLVAVFALNFNITLPLLATEPGGGGLASVSTLLVLSSLAAVASSLGIVRFRSLRVRNLLFASGVLVVGMTILGLFGHHLIVAGAAMLLIGGAIAATTATTNTILQHHSDPSQRGRIMAVYGLIMRGSALIGAPLLGYLSERSVLGAGGGLIFGAGAVVAGMLACGLVASRRVAAVGTPQPQLLPGVGSPD